MPGWMPPLNVGWRWDTIWPLWKSYAFQTPMSQITARLPDELVESLDRVAAELRRKRADIVRQAVEYYLDDHEDVSRAIEVLRDPADPLRDWKAVRRDLLR
jgi:RHH-type rel operon transcriptional repressor/antitoxin RelB